MWFFKMTISKLILDGCTLQRLSQPSKNMNPWVTFSSTKSTYLFLYSWPDCVIEIFGLLGHDFSGSSVTSTCNTGFHSCELQCPSVETRGATLTSQGVSWRVNGWNRWSPVLSLLILSVSTTVNFFPDIFQVPRLL